MAPTTASSAHLGTTPSPRSRSARMRGQPEAAPRGERPPAGPGQRQAGAEEDRAHAEGQSERCARWSSQSTYRQPPPSPPTPTSRTGFPARRCSSRGFVQAERHELDVGGAFQHQRSGEGRGPGPAGPGSRAGPQPGGGAAQPALIDGLVAREVARLGGRRTASRAAAAQAAAARITTPPGPHRRHARPPAPLPSRKLPLSSAPKPRDRRESARGRASALAERSGRGAVARAPANATTTTIAPRGAPASTNAPVADSAAASSPAKREN